MKKKEAAEIEVVNKSKNKRDTHKLTCTISPDRD
jgi:hypothetical protein